MRTAQLMPPLCSHPAPRPHPPPDGLPAHTHTSTRPPPSPCAALARACTCRASLPQPEGSSPSPLPSGLGSVGELSPSCTMERADLPAASSPGAVVLSAQSTEHRAWARTADAACWLVCAGSQGSPSGLWGRRPAEDCLCLRWAIAGKMKALPSLGNSQREAGREAHCRSAWLCYASALLPAPETPWDVAGQRTPASSADGSLEEGTMSCKGAAPAVCCPHHLPQREPDSEGVSGAARGEQSGASTKRGAPTCQHKPQTLWGEGGQESWAA